MFAKKQNEKAKALSDCTRNLKESRDRVFFLVNTVRSMLMLLKDFALDRPELNTASYLDNIDMLADDIEQETNLKKLKAGVVRKKKLIYAFVEQQQQYLNEREAELQKIVELLTQAMMDISSDNKEYNQKLYHTSQEIEGVARLDDIRKIKQTLEREVNNLRKTIKDKESRDDKQVELLSKKVSILNSQLEQATQASLKDGLTQIYNRRALDHYLEKALDDSNSGNKSMAVLILDIDDFKVINDTYGHLIGDRVLLALTETCKQNIRSEDFLARYGGEEFVIVLPGASLRNGVKKAKTVCKAVADSRYDLEDDKGQSALSMTVSIGVSVYQRGDTVEMLLERGDQSLYMAKRTGKNRVVSQKSLK